MRDDVKNKSEKIGEIMRKHPIVIEMITAIGALAFLIYMLRSMLIFGESTLVHDNHLWNYPVFQFFAENIINGYFPFWNPFDHGGEPFYPLILQIKLLEPITFLTIYIGQFATNDIVMLFNWDHFIRNLVMIFGVYIVFRQLARNLFIRLSLMPILLYSSFMLGSFREDFTLQFMWVPFITYFLLRIIYYKDYRWNNWLLLAALIGLNWQSYLFTGTWIFLLFFSVGVMLFRKDLLEELFGAKMIMLKFAVMASIIFTMAMPNIVLMLEKDKYVFPARMLDASYDGQKPQGGPFQHEVGISSKVVDGIKMPYDFIVSTGTFSNIWNFIQIISPDGNNYISWPSVSGWGKPSEAYMYLGLLPWAVALLGLVAGRHDMKKVWLLIFLCFGLLMIGPAGKLHRLLYYIYPPMWFVRHTHTFVLFFLFALIYFYILGFNHIFNTWRSAIFGSDKPQGILSYFIKNEKVCGVIAFFIFSACIVLSVYLITRLAYPAKNYRFGLLALIVVSWWFLRKDLGEKGLYISLITSHIVIVLICSINTSKFIIYLLSILGLPFALFIFLKSHKNPFNGLRHYAPPILLFVFSVSLVFDLVYSLQKSSFLYQGEKHPSVTLNSKTMPQNPFLPQNRLIEPHNYTAYSEQGVRYLPIVYRQPFAFSPIMDPDYSASYVGVKKVFNGLTNRSFENWVRFSEVNSLPEQFTYHQDGSGGAVERYVKQDGVKDGVASVLLKPSSTGNSYLSYQTSNIEELRGQYVRLSLWVKSQNRVPDVIKVDFQVDNGPVTSKFYNNSGEWKYLTMGKYIDKGATKLAILCSINSHATMPVYLDGFNMEIVEIKPEFESALKAKRWSSFLLLKKYFKLIHMDISSLVLEEMFAVGKPMFQFKKGIVHMEDSGLADFLRQLGPAKSVKLLQETVIIDKDIEPSLIGLKRVKEEFEKTTPEPVNVGNFKHKRNVSHIKEENKFTYAIESYNYNKLEMKVSAESDGMLYWADGYDEGWHAYINGEGVPIYRANINFKAIGLPKGNSNIILTYKPSLFYISLFTFYSSFMVCIFSALYTAFYV